MKKRFLKKGKDGKWVVVNVDEKKSGLTINEGEELVEIPELETLVQEDLTVNPYRNEHAARLRDPDMAHIRVARTKGSGKGQVQGVSVPATISVIWFIVKTEDGGEAPVAQALRFPTKSWTADKAKKWIKDNEIKTVSFEPAAAPTTQSANPSLRHLMSNLIREEKLDDRTYLVAPTILIVEGVHNNVFYPESELAKFPQSWDGRPVVVVREKGHPMKNGKPVSANSPEMKEKVTVGATYNTTWNSEDKRLHSEVWIDLEKCKKVAPSVLAKLQQNQNIEVSTGLFTECDGISGDWNGEAFLGTVFNYRPDHLALLPEDVGACSWEDGAGLPRVNKEEDQVEVKFIGLNVNELSHDDIHMSLGEALRVKFAGDIKQNKYVFVRGVWDKHFIYTKEDKEGATLYKQGYSLDANDKVQFVGEPVEVKMKVDYEPVRNSEQNKGTTKDGGSKQGGPMDRAAQVLALIALNCGWGEADKEALTGMSDELFSKVESQAKLLANKDKKPEEKSPEKKPEAKPPEKKSPDVNTAPKEPETVEQVLEGIKNPDLRATLNRAVARDKEIKDGMVAELVGNKACKYTKEQLNSKSIEDLEMLLTLAGSEKKPADFSVKAPSTPDVNKEEGVPAMPVLCPKAKKE